VLRTIGDRISDAATRTRERLEHVAVDDPVSCDLLVQVAATLEKQLWRSVPRCQTPHERSSRGPRTQTEPGGPNGEFARALTGADRLPAS
jgi:hypothetical protein